MEIFFTHERLDDFRIVEEMLLSNRLLIDPADTESDHSYRLINYIVSIDTEFKCLLDRNIVSYLIALAKGKIVTSNKVDECYKLTAGLQAFFSAANIMSEPGIAYHEYMDSSDIKTADQELSIFRAADNLDGHIYLDIATGVRSSIQKSEIKVYEGGELLNAKIPSKLRHFETNIVILKKALSLKSKGKADYHVLLELIDWMHKYYLFSAPTFHFLSIYFSSKKISRMLKSISVAGIRNATWDLCLIQQLNTCANREQENNTNIRWLLSTFDRAIKSTIDFVFTRPEESINDYYSRLEILYSKMWGKKNRYGYDLLDKLMSFHKPEKREERNIIKYHGDDEYILSLRTEVDEEFQKNVIGS